MSTNPSTPEKPPGVVELRKFHSDWLKAQRCWALTAPKETLAPKLVELGVIPAVPVWPKRAPPPNPKGTKGVTVRKQPLDDPARITPRKIDFDGKGKGHGGVSKELENTRADSAKRRAARAAAVAEYLRQTSKGRDDLGDSCSENGESGSGSGS